LLSEYLNGVPGGTRTPYQIAREIGFIGGFASGHGKLAENRKQYPRDRLRAQRSR
jgi:hypothetical protein